MCREKKEAMGTGALGTGRTTQSVSGHKAALCPSVREVLEKA